jgi:hypothetical protein
VGLTSRRICGRNTGNHPRIRAVLEAEKNNAMKAL